MRFDENGQLVKNEVGVKDLNEVEGMKKVTHLFVDEVGEEAVSSRIADVKSQLEMNEEKDREREKIRIKEKKMIKKQREKELNKVEPIPQVVLGDSMDEEEQFYYVVCFIIRYHIISTQVLLSRMT